MDQAGLRDWAGDWPGVEESIKWGEDLVFSVAGKMFCVTRAHGAGALSFKVEDDRFLELTERPGFQPAPYLARSHWVMVSSLPACGLMSFARSCAAVTSWCVKSCRRRHSANWPTEMLASCVVPGVTPTRRAHRACIGATSPDARLAPLFDALIETF